MYSTSFISITQSLPKALRHTLKSGIELAVCLAFIKSKSKLCYDQRSVGQSVMVSSTLLGLTTRFLLQSDSFGVVGMGRSLWRENGPAVSIADDPCQLVFFGSESLHDHILLSQYWDFPFRRLLRLAGSRWRYSTPPPHGRIYFHGFSVSSIVSCWFIDMVTWSDNVLNCRCLEIYLIITHCYRCRYLRTSTLPSNCCI
jgi:hypothetical protein